MFKIFGYNVLRDWELKKIKQDHWDDFQKYLKIKDLYRLGYNWDRKPKCSACDENRQLTITLPDGTTKKISCSCDYTIETRSIEKVEEKYIIAVKDEKIYITNSFSEWEIDHLVVFKESELHTIKRLDDCYFTSKKLAEKALKILESNKR